MTILYILFALFLLVIIFGATYLIKGLKTALITTGVMLVTFVILYVEMIYLIVNSMD